MVKTGADIKLQLFFLTKNFFFTNDRPGIIKKPLPLMDQEGSRYKTLSIKFIAQRAKENLIIDDLPS